MRKQVSRVAGTLGMALGIAVIGGSIIGGIALATDDHSKSEPTITDMADTAPDEATSDGDGGTDAAPTTAPDAGDASYGDDSGEDSSSYGDDDADEEPGDDDAGDDDAGDDDADGHDDHDDGYDD